MFDEQERTDQFVELVGGTHKADQLDQIYAHSYPSGTAYDRLTGHGKSRDEVFEDNAKRAGFSKKVIQFYLSL